MECKDEDGVKCDSFDSDLQKYMVSFHKDQWKKKAGLEEKIMVWFGNGLQYQIFEFRCQIENCYAYGELREEVKQLKNNFTSSKKKKMVKYMSLSFRKRKREWRREREREWM